MKKNTLVQVTQNGMGAGSEELGVKLITNYFKLLLADSRLPRIIVFYNGGVQLLSSDSPAINALQDLQNRGVQLLACKTCIDFYGLTDKIQVGNVGTMSDIMTLQVNADKIINL